MKKNKMLSFFALASLAVVIFSGFGCSDNTPFGTSNTFVAEKSFELEMHVDGQTRFRLEGISGTINVTGLEGAESVKITGKRRVESDSNHDAQRRLQDLQVSAESYSNELYVRTIQPGDTGSHNYVVDYTITLPGDLDVIVSNISGEISVTSLNSIVEANCISGNVFLNDNVGSAFAHVTSGNIRGTVSLPKNGEVDLQTISGNVLLDIPQNSSAVFSASVVSGSISVSGITLSDSEHTPTSLSGICGSGEGRIDLGTISGNVRVSGF